MVPVTSESEQQWLRVHAYLNRNRHDLAVRAAAGYPAENRVAGTPLLAPPAWRPRFPVPLGDVRLEFREQAPAPRVTDIADIAPEQLPARADGTRYRRYSDVVLELASPAIFENRSTYRLLDADLTGERPHLTFTRGRFFDGVDVGGPGGARVRRRRTPARSRYAAAPRHRGPVGPGRAPGGHRRRRADPPQ